VFACSARTNVRIGIGRRLADFIPAVGTI